MTRTLPPVADPHALHTEMRYVRAEDRPDAVQEAWVAHLEGRNPARAVATFAQRLRRQRQRTLISSVLAQGD
jgi:hypothetical protein